MASLAEVLVQNYAMLYCVVVAHVYIVFIRCREPLFSLKFRDCDLAPGPTFDCYAANEA